MILRAFNFLFELFEWTFFFLGREGENCVLDILSLHAMLIECAYSLAFIFQLLTQKFKTHIIRPSVCPDISFPAKISDIFPTFHLEPFFVTGLLLRCVLFRKFFTQTYVWNFSFVSRHIPYPTAFPYGNGMVLHFYQQQESSTTKTVHKVINKGLKAYV